MYVTLSFALNGTATETKSHALAVDCLTYDACWPLGSLLFSFVLLCRGYGVLFGIRDDADARGRTEHKLTLGMTGIMSSLLKPLGIKVSSYSLSIPIESRGVNNVKRTWSFRSPASRKQCVRRAPAHGTAEFYTAINKRLCHVASV